MAGVTTQNLRNDIDSLVRKLEEDLWKCLESWLIRQEMCEDDQLSQIDLVEPESSCKSLESIIAVKDVHEHGLTSEKRLKSSSMFQDESPKPVSAVLDRTAVQVTDLDSPMSNLVPRALDMSAVSSKADNQALCLSSMDSEGGILRVSGLGTLDFSTSVLQGSPLSAIHGIESPHRMMDRSPARLQLTSGWGQPKWPDISTTGTPKQDRHENFRIQESSPLIGSMLPQTNSPLFHKRACEDYFVKERVVEAVVSSATVGTSHACWQSSEGSMRAKIRKLMRIPSFQILMSVTLVLNAIFTVWQVDSGVRFSLDMDQILVSDIVSDLFFAFFFAELLLRFFAERKECCRCNWTLAGNLLDVIVVITLAVDMFIHWWQYSNCTVNMTLALITSKLSILRILRIATVLPRFRLVCPDLVLEELATMNLAVSLVAKSAMWGLLLASLSLVFFAAFFTECSFAFVQGDEVSNVAVSIQSHEDTLAGFFKSYQRTCLSLFMVVTAGIDYMDIWHVLSPLSAVYKVVFVTFLLTELLILVNVMTSIIIRISLMAQVQKEEKPELSEKEWIDQLRNLVYSELGRDGTTAETLVSFGDVEDCLVREPLLNFFKATHIEVPTVHSLLTVLAQDKQGRVQVEEFVMHCFHLRCAQRCINMARLQYQVECILQHTALLIAEGKDNFGALLPDC